ncbi:32820_t:CDS:2 [Gigaspora margarita]|uniref:32820_t:CDS:1 n=1 Tax=Gigaspora margarita TaxID=4874 RepID=A0ABN7V6D9_GIGMA|nr:32820_t:CDS:2 [Gigaspora margarita]
MNESTTKVRFQLIFEQKSYSNEINLLKSNIKILKKKTTLVQKASSIDKITILSFKAKIGELEAKKVIEITNKQEKPKLPDWVHSNLKSLVYELGLENKVWEIDKICSQCQQPIYPKDDNNTLTLLKKEEYMVKKLFKYLSKEPQNFSPISKSIDIENSITSKMIFVKIYNKIVQAEKILEKRIFLDSYYLLGEALVKKLAEFETNYPLQTAQTLLNAEIKNQFLSDISCNIFNKKKCSAINIYKIFSTEGLKKDDIKQIRKISPSAFERFNNK